MGSLTHNLALEHCLTRLPTAAQHPRMHRYSLAHSWGSLSLWDTQCLQQGQEALIPHSTNNPTVLPEPHGRILVGPSSPPHSCDQEFGNTIPISKQQTSYVALAHDDHAHCVHAMGSPGSLAGTPLCPP